MASDDLQECLICTKRTTLRCSKCSSVYFCSTEHQKLVLCAAGGVFVIPPLSPAEAAFLLSVRHEANYDVKTRIRETSLQMLQRWGLLPREQQWDDLLLDLQRPIADCTISEPRRSAILSPLRFRLAAPMAPPGDEPRIPSSPWSMASVGNCQFVIESYCPSFAPRPDPTLWTRASEFLKQDVLACALTQKSVRRQCDPALVNLAYERAIKLFEEVDVDPAFRQHHLGHLRSSRASGTACSIQ